MKYELDQTQKLESQLEGTHWIIIEFIQSKPDTREVLDSQLTEPDIGEPESDIFKPPYSPHVKVVITDSLPPSLISIEELTSDK